MAIDVECVVDARADTGECPLWDPREQVLWWVDIPAGALYRFDPSNGGNRRHAMPAPIGSFALCATGGLLVALKTGLFRFDPTTGRLETVARAPFAHPDDRFNDGRCDREGRFWVTSMRDPQDPEARAGRLHRLDPDHSLRSPIDGLIVGNGLAFSPDGRTMYLSDSHVSVQTIWAFDYDPGRGKPRNRRVFAAMHDLAGRPDGAAVDQEGCYWIAANSGGQLVRYTPDGRVDLQVPLPVQRPTMIAFGGRELDVIYVTSQRPRPGETTEGQPQAGGLFALSAGIKGLPEPRFRG